jgi:hypothetical protein
MEQEFADRIPISNIHRLGLHNLDWDWPVAPMAGGSKPLASQL